MKRVFAKFYNAYLQYSNVRPYKTDLLYYDKLTKEVGEIAEAMAARWGSDAKLKKIKAKQQTVEEAITEEIGDAIVVLLNLTTSCQITHKDLFSAITRKLKDRALVYVKKRDKNE